MIELVAYGDFNCPYSAVASGRVAELERRGVVAVDWRAVEHDTEIPRAGAEVAGDLASELLAELDEINALLMEGETNRLQLPARQVNTSLAVERFAGTSARNRPAVREEIFVAHWVRGARIDEADVLDRAGAGRVDPVVAREWRARWQDATTPIVPVLVLPDGYVSRGLGVLARLAAMLQDRSTLLPSAPGARSDRGVNGESAAS